MTAIAGLEPPTVAATGHRCEWCGATLWAGSPARRRYCDAACRSDACKDRRGRAEAAAWVEDLAALSREAPPRALEALTLAARQDGACASVTSGAAGWCPPRTAAR